MDNIEAQQNAFALLADPATHGGAHVRRIDTHAAVVFLAGERVYKVKRAVKFPFLDYSTLTQRKAACESELEVNRPFAPDIYRAVVAITRENNGRLALGGNGEPVEWAVEMRRFDENATLDHLSGRGRIDVALADALGAAVAAAHVRAPVVEAASWIDALARFIEQNAAAFRGAPDVFPEVNVAALTRASRAALERLRPLLLERGAEGLIRRGHGDLHLGNIALIGGRPVLFDAIEFDPLIAAGDVLYDLAFLLMDLAERGLSDAANTVFNRYIGDARRDSDLAALRALPLFMSVRAAIRAKVTAARLETADTDERPAIIKSATAYFRFACASIAPVRPMLIAVGGLSGTGKSALARMLAPHIGPAPGALVLRSDVERKVMLGVRETDKLDAAAYTREVTQKVYAALARKAQCVIRAGHSAVVDAVFAQLEERAAIEAVGATAGVPFGGLFLFADLATRLERVGSRRGDASDADATVAQQQEAYDLGRVGWDKVDASGDIDTTLAHARAALAR